MENKYINIFLLVLFCLILISCGSGNSDVSDDDDDNDDADDETVETTFRVSVSSSGAEANHNSYAPSISSDGRYVAFESLANNLVTLDTGGFRDIFVHDGTTGETFRVSINSGATQANGHSSAPSISSDGRCIAFESSASNLVDSDTNGFSDIFVHDRDTGETKRVSVDSSGADADGGSFAPSISSDCTRIAFESLATNLVADDTNGLTDIFVRDLNDDTTTRVSVDSSGADADRSSSAPSISSDGKYIAFESSATDLVADDTNGLTDIFVRDLNNNTTTRVSVDSNGAQANGNSKAPSISSDGTYIAFESEADNLVSGDTNGFSDIFVHNLITPATTIVSVDFGGAGVNGDSNAPSISLDGRYIAFVSSAGDLVTDDTNGRRDIFVRDGNPDTTSTTRVSVDSTGADANNESIAPSISSDGKYIAFQSQASDLVTGDNNGLKDIFVRVR